ncbi:DUF4184 family protein [Crassaminicella thermophila]|nr:DUF4184 family protein [Crassaminicella thermophila]
MPFTFSHPSITIPIKKKLGKYADFTALIIGSMAPDFEYFLRFKPVGFIGHTVLGFLYFNLPLCFIIAYIYHYIVKDLFILCLPKPLDSWYEYLMQSRSKWELKDIKRIIIFIYSAFIGMFSHVFWDAFTHKSGYFVNGLSLLTDNFVIRNYKVPIYKLMQHGSTMIGFIIILFYLYLIRDKKALRKNRFSYKLKFIYYICFLSSGIIMLFYRFHNIEILKYNYLGIYLVTFINGCAIGMVIVSIILKYIMKIEYH